MNEEFKALWNELKNDLDFCRDAFYHSLDLMQETMGDLPEGQMPSTENMDILAGEAEEIYNIGTHFNRITAKLKEAMKS